MYNDFMQTAVTYNRYSQGPDQREESITGQLRENHKLAKDRDLVVIHDYIDRSISGRTDDRPQFRQMIKDAEKGQFKYVICYQTSRFARDKYDAVVYKKRLKKYGVKVIYSKMNIPEGPEGMILESVLEALDEYYSEELKQKVMRGMYDNALQGKASGGSIPFGLKLDKDKHFIVDEEKSPIVREIFKRYAAGEKAVDICTDLNNRGYRTQKGNLFNKNSLHHMFKNEKYIGIFKFKSKDPDLKEVYKDDVIPAIITRDLFEKVQLRIKNNKHRTSRKRLDERYFLLSGKAFDGNCGGAFIGDSGTGRSGETYYYYTCQNRKHKKQCKTKSVKKEWFEDVVIEATRHIVLDDKLINSISDWIVKLQEEDVDDTTLRAAQAELKQTNTSIKNILKAIEQGIITDTTKNRLVELETRQVQLENEVKLEKAKLRAPKLKKEQVIFWLEQFRSGKADKEIYRKQVIDTFVNTVIMDDDVITIAYNYADNDILDIPLPQIKNPPDSVRMSLIDWA